MAGVIIKSDAMTGAVADQFVEKMGEHLSRLFRQMEKDVLAMLDSDAEIEDILSGIAGVIDNGVQEDVGDIDQRVSAAFQDKTVKEKSR